MKERELYVKNGRADTIMNLNSVTTFLLFLCWPALLFKNSVELQFLWTVL